MKTLIIADPIPSLEPGYDTALAMLREALRRGHEVFWSIPKDLALVENRLLVRAAPVSECLPGNLPAIKEEVSGIEVSSFKTIWIRKDPPFDQDYVTLCWLLGLVEGKTLIVNRPSTLLRYHEKLLPLEALYQGFLSEEDLIPTTLSQGSEVTPPAPSWSGPFLTKPWRGHGGREVQVWSSFHEAVASLKGKKEATVIQPFLKEISEKGDRRILFINGEYAGDFIRMPAPGSPIANLQRGGQPKMVPLTEREKKLIDKLSLFLKTAKITVAGADCIGGRLSEINITAPSGFQDIVELGGPDAGKIYLDFVEEKVRTSKE